ncbi:MAG: hypothetical protein IJU40_00570, partial [Desulfovibrionaceae bacterium]|nr:hypothetical protein [Desulfovibrionaceae bacterium]
MSEFILPSYLTYKCADAKEIAIRLRSSARAKHFSIKLNQGEFILTVPKDRSYSQIQSVLQHLSPWIEKHLPLARTIQKVIAHKVPLEIAIPLEKAIYQLYLENDLAKAASQINEANLSFLLEEGTKKIA